MSLRAESLEADSASKDILRMWLRLIACESQIEQFVRSRLRSKYDITLPQFDVLSELDHMGKALTMTELSNQLMVSNGNCTGVVDRLVRDQYVERVPSPKDRRVLLISLTRKGRSEFRKIARQHEMWLADLLDDISLRDVQHVSKLLKKIRDSVKSKSENSSL